MAIHAVLEVGSSKVGALVCSESSGRARVLGYGLAPCRGAKIGAVTDLESTASAIREAVSRAERRAARAITQVYANVAQPRVFGLAAQLVADREALVLAAERGGLRVIELVPSAIASAAAILSAEERQHGAAVVDLGAGVTNVVAYRAGCAVLTHVIGFGSADVTASIAAHFGLSEAEAEFLKCNIGGVEPTGADVLAVPSCARGEGTAVEGRALARVIDGRLLPMWRSVARVLAGLDLGAGIAITGGGSAFAHMHELAERVLERPVRRASPFGLGDLPGELQRPQHACLVGLAQHVAVQAAKFGPRTAWSRRRPAIA